MTDAEYLDALRVAAEDGDEQAAAVLKMLESRLPQLFETDD